ncbi:carboxypeptidase-like regulatory domain-containing protein [Patiriisocius marinus]|uniref:carboxypeptidase-like regulatory domain-containing protein n=1 Tax=Patiriisocius marinus TaxID=1397112 RepID=UPI0023306962|nr:carboxypeptidase-like regulatory domain-containing protein [Patiriisocius marinus]
MKHFLLFISLCAIGISYGQEQTITGVVTAENNKIQGATVSVKNSFNETVTDKDGKFSLKVSDDDNVLEVFYFGLEYKEVSINRGQIMNISLQRDAELLEEVLLVGKVKEKEELVETAYGKQNKKALGYSVGQELTEDDILPSDVNTFELLRKMPGVEVYGTAGLGQSVLFTKNKSITSAPPGVSVDGAVFDQSVLASIDPSAITSIKLLKSLNSTLRYGQLGAGGMILITTKVGGGGKISVQEKVKSLQVKGNEYVENLQLIENYNTKSNFLIELEKSTTFEEANKLFQDKKNTSAGNTVPFYMESSDYFKRWDKEYSLEILTNIAKMAKNNPKALKAYAYKLEERGEFKKVVSIYNRILALRPDSAQAYRDLALACEAAGDYETAFTLFYQIVYNKIPNVDCTGIQELAYNEFRHLLAFHKLKVPYKTLPNEMLTVGYKQDIRIVVEWTDAPVDFDMQYVSPDNKFFAWSHTKFSNQKQLEDEVKSGYAVKEQIIDDAKTGKWLVNLQYFEMEQSKNPTYMKYTIFQDYGLPSETKTIKVIPLFTINDKVTIDTFIND